MNKQNIPINEFKVSKGIFYNIASSIKKDADKNKKNEFYSSLLQYDEKEDFFDDLAHKQALEDTVILNEEEQKTINDILELCESKQEKDVILSIANGEKPQDFADRNELEYSAVIQRRRRTINKIMKRVSMFNNASSDMEANNG